MYQLAARLLSTDGPIRVTSHTLTQSIRIEHDGTSIRFRTSTLLRSLQHVAKFLGAMQITAPIKVLVSGVGLLNEDGSEQASVFPLEILNLPTVVELKLDHYGDALRVLEKLGHRGSGRGSGWLCPGLEMIGLERVEGLTQDIVDNFRKRRPGVALGLRSGLV